MGETRADLLEALPPLGNADRAKAGESGESAPLAAGPVMPRREYFDWRQFDPAVHLHAGDPMAEELATYGERLGELLPYEGQYVLIKGREIFGVFPTRRAGLDEAVDRFGDDRAMVKRIVALQPIERIGHAVP
jgi:hypothetical protein